MGFVPISADGQDENGFSVITFQYFSDMKKNVCPKACYIFLLKVGREKICSWSNARYHRKKALAFHTFPGSSQLQHHSNTSQLLVISTALNFKKYFMDFTPDEIITTFFVAFLQINQLSGQP